MGSNIYSIICHQKNNGVQPVKPTIRSGFAVLSLTAANELIWKKFQHIEMGHEQVDILEGLDRIVAEDIVSPVDVPGFSRSMCDGYAVVASDTQGASEDNPVSLSYLGEVPPGVNAAMEVKEGQCAYVSTGSMIPPGADAVIMVERTKQSEEGFIQVSMQMKSGQFMMGQGSDIKAGSLLIEWGKKLSAGNIGALVAAGIYKIKVFNRLRFAIIATGDELVDAGQDLSPGQIRDSNSYALQALITKAGGEVIRRVLVKDNRELYKQELENAVKCADVVLISGGCSVGIRDFTAEAINELPGEGVFIHGIEIRPGRPLIVGESMGKPVFGLPGHPVAPVLLFKTVVEELWRRLVACREEADSIIAVFDFDMSPCIFTHLFVQLEKGDDSIIARPAFKGNPTQTSAISRAGGYIWIKDPEQGLCRGQAVKVFVL
jgi:molybdopterin molybdotransferase